MRGSKLPEKCCGEVTLERRGQAAFNEKAKRTSVFSYAQAVIFPHSFVAPA
jgi:hypothetical protein